MKEMELYKKHRPKKLDRIIGQEAAVKTLKGMIQKKRVPHTLLFTGPSGCGKTTLARILRRELNCGKYDFIELNCADVRGIETVRKIRQQMKTVPMHGDCRIWLIDEAHKLTNEAQNALLKMTEDTPEHVYFMMATTDTQKLLRTLRNRGTEIAVKALNKTGLNKLLGRVCKKEGIKISEEVVEKIREHSEGSARKTLVLLNQIRGLENKKDMLEIISQATMESQSKLIFRALMNPKTSWAKMAGILKDCETEEAEFLRWRVMGYARAVLLSATGGNKMTGLSYIILDAFRDNFYDSKHSGLAAACYEVIVGAE